MTIFMAAVPWRLLGKNCGNEKGNLGRQHGFWIIQNIMAPLNTPSFECLRHLCLVEQDDGRPSQKGAVANQGAIRISEPRHRFHQKMS